MEPADAPPPSAPPSSAGDAPPALEQTLVSGSSAGVSAAVAGESACDATPAAPPPALGASAAPAGASPALPAAAAAAPSPFPESGDPGAGAAPPDVRLPPPMAHFPSALLGARPPPMQLPKGAYGWDQARLVFPGAPPCGAPPYGGPSGDAPPQAVAAAPWGPGPFFRPGFPYFDPSQLPPRSGAMGGQLPGQLRRWDAPPGGPLYHPGLHPMALQNPMPDYYHLPLPLDGAPAPAPGLAPPYDLGAAPPWAPPPPPADAAPPAGLAPPKPRAKSPRPVVNIAPAPPPTNGQAPAGQRFLRPSELFANDYRSAVRAEHPAYLDRAVRNRLSAMWRHVDAGTRASYVDRARREREKARLQGRGYAPAAPREDDEELDEDDRKFDEESAYAPPPPAVVKKPPRPKAGARRPNGAGPRRGGAGAAGLQPGQAVCCANDASRRGVVVKQTAGSWLLVRFARGGETKARPSQLRALRADEALSADERAALAAPFDAVRDVQDAIDADVRVASSDGGFLPNAYVDKGGERQGRTRERNSQLQRLISRPFSTRFG